MQENFYDRVHITANCFYFNLNVLKFESQIECPPEILICGYLVSQLLCHNVGRAHDIKCR